MRNDGFRGPKRQGGWIGSLISTGVGALLSRRGERSANRRADADRAADLNLQNRRLDLAESQEERAEDLYQHYRSTYQPREDELLRDAFDDEDSTARDEAEATRDVRASLESARGMRGRRMRRLGVNPASGRYVAGERSANLEEARIEAGARTRARRGSREDSFRKKIWAIDTGRGLPSSAGYLSATGAGQVGGVANLANMRSRMSDYYSGEAGYQAGASIGDLVSTGVDAWQGHRRSRSEGARWDDILGSRG